MCGCPMSHGVGCLIITEDGHLLSTSVGAGCRLRSLPYIEAPDSWPGFRPHCMSPGFLLDRGKSITDTATMVLTKSIRVLAQG